MLWGGDLRLSVCGVSFAYDGSEVLSDITFEISEGEVVGIIGPNGSGKTTLLKCINRVLKPKTGTVMIDERDLRELNRKEIAQVIGVVPQNNEISFPFTALDIVMMGRMPALQPFQRESEEDLRIAKEAMRTTNVLHLADREIDQLSGGEKQRVIIARALAQRPRILLLDEPTLHLDVNHQLEILDLVQNLARNEELTVLMVSHDLSLAARYCDKLILLNGGRIKAAGKVEEVLTEENLQKVFGINAFVRFEPEIDSYIVIIKSVCKEDDGRDSG